MNKITIYFKNGSNISGLLINEFYDLDCGEYIVKNINKEEILYIKFFKNDSFTLDEKMHQKAVAIVDEKIEAIENEKKEVVKKSKSFEINSGVKVQYGTPNFSTFKNTK